MRIYKFQKIRPNFKQSIARYFDENDYILNLISKGSPLGVLRPIEQTATHYQFIHMLNKRRFLISSYRFSKMRITPAPHPCCELIMNQSVSPQNINARHMFDPNLKQPFSSRNAPKFRYKDAGLFLILLPEIQ